MTAIDHIGWASLVNIDHPKRSFLFLVNCRGQSLADGIQCSLRSIGEM